MEDQQEAWSRQQAELAARVRQEDGTDWRLGEPDRCTLRLVGGLDISFFPSATCSYSTGLEEGGAAAAEARVGAEGPPASGAAVVAAEAGPSHQQQQQDDHQQPESAVAALVVLSFPQLEPVYEDLQEVALAVPYRPGFLGFREVPAYMQLLERARSKGVEPQVLLVDGFGVLHPRGLGSASHLGVLAGIPTIGVAKNLLHVGGLDQKAVRAECRAAQHAQQAQQRSVGDASAEPHTPFTAAAAPFPAAAAVAAEQVPEPIPLRGSSDAALGAAVCPPGCSRPIYISVGHLLSLGTAIAITLRCCRHRVPEPIRQADLRSRERVRQLVAAKQT